jgi:hypothetical protein
MQQPVNRFCPSCGTDVEDVGGFCMLGHSLKVSAPTADLSTLRAEVDAAFEEAKLQVAAVLGGSTTATAVVPSPAPTVRPRIQVTLPEAEAPASTTPPVAAPAAVGETPLKTPPPPPIGSNGRTNTQPLVVPSQPLTNASDPITAFAPPPHMDWGPQRKRFRRG